MSAPWLEIALIGAGYFAGLVTFALVSMSRGLDDHDEVQAPPPHVAGEMSAPPLF